MTLLTTQFSVFRTQESAHITPPTTQLAVFRAQEGAHMTPPTTQLAVFRAQAGAHMTPPTTQLAVFRAHEGALMTLPGTSPENEEHQFGEKFLSLWGSSRATHQNDDLMRGRDLQDMMEGHVVSKSAIHGLPVTQLLYSAQVRFNSGVCSEACAQQDRASSGFIHDAQSTESIFTKWLTRHATFKLPSFF